MSLNAKQTLALNAVKDGRNVFLTGAGGTGKSLTIRSIVSWARTVGVRVCVTAMTGCAALLLNLSAKTLHSWAGVGLAREPLDELLATVRRNKRAQARWIDTRLLIIDEVSMMTPEFLEKLDYIGRNIRKRPDTPFGGLQVVLCGDFAQLPPVSKGAATFAFESPLWSRLVHVTVYLTEIHRQKDPVFQTLLNEARMGAVSDASVKLLEERMGLAWQDHEIRPTLLFARNAEVDMINRTNLDALTGERHEYDVETYSTGVVVRRIYGVEQTGVRVSEDDPDVQIGLERMDTDAPYDAHLEIVVGAQVMLLVNMDTERGLVNGSRGVVTAFSDAESPLPIVKFIGIPEPILIDRAKWELPDYKGIGRSQIPLKVAFAITIHKSQGASLDSALVDIGSATFEYGQAYVALSRVRSIEGLYVWKLDVSKIRAHPKVVAFYARLAAATEVEDAEATNGTGDPEPVNPTLPLGPRWSSDGLSSAWAPLVDAFLSSPTGHQLVTRISESTTPIQPAPEEVFAALRVCPDPAAIKVVILGQDPYPTAGVPHGLAFSVRPGSKLPPSLVNIFRELVTDLGCVAPTLSGCLLPWAQQGVLLLNDVLTVAVGAPQSHSGLGWEQLTSQLLQETLRASPHVVVLAWGRFAQKKLESTAMKALVAARGHTVLRAPHPSPLSAHTGFYGSRPFSQANADLIAHGLEPVEWVPAKN